ncbi:MAG: hypothetical protein KDA92_22880, partial [Planctomycetales bacterium]|nr:hypothetical protein [Planctomycetales bacterium]
MPTRSRRRPGRIRHLEHLEARRLLVGSVDGYVWHDLDRDGGRRGDEYGVAGVTVRLITEAGGLADQTRTNDRGHYRFDNIVPDDYFVEFILPDGTE